MTEINESPEASGNSENAGQAWQNAGEQVESSKEAKNLAMLCHLLGLVGFFAPLVIWLNEKDKHKFVDDHGKAAMNYQISIMIYYLACWLLCLIFIGFILLPVLIVLHIIFVITASVKASGGKAWRYPIAIRFI